MRTNSKIRTISLALLAGSMPLAMLPGAPVASAARAQISIGVSVNIAPPALPVYEQPPCPDADYIWTPGYWAWGGDDYYWVPGTWVVAPDPGLFWTPSYWGWNNGVYVFNEGYWGPSVGFYGGIDYGFGYGGHGYDGGRWDNGHFFYNTAVNNVNVTVVHNTYVDKTVIVNNNTRVSFNGGNGGVTARPTVEEEAAAHQQHVPAVAAQTRQAQAARGDQQLHASYNHGAPPVAATARPGSFTGSGVVAAHNAPAARTPAHPETTARPEINNAPAHPNPAPNNEMRPNNPTNSNNAPRTEPKTTPDTNRRQLDRQPANESRPTVTHETNPPAQTEHKPAQPQHQSQPMERPAPQTEERQTPHPSPEVHQQAAPAPRPAPEEHAAPAPHPQPEQRAAPQQDDHKDQH